MSDEKEYRIPDKHYHGEIRLTPKGTELELAVYDGEGIGDEMSITLDAVGVRKLRLAVQRIEREAKA